MPASAPVRRPQNARLRAGRAFFLRAGRKPRHAESRVDAPNPRPSLLNSRTNRGAPVGSVDLQRNLSYRHGLTIICTYMDDFSTIGARFRAERKRLGLTQDEMASAIGVSRGTVVACEAGRSYLDVQTLERARNVGMDTWWVQTGESGAPTRRTIDDEDWQLLESLAEGVRKFVAERSLATDLPFQLGLLRLAYDGFVRNTPPADRAAKPEKRAA